MNSDSISDARAASASRKGLIIAVVASLVLLALAAYRLPLLQNETKGVIVGVSEVHDKTGSKLIAAVQLEMGTKILVPLPEDISLQESANVRVKVGSSLFGHKSYRIIAGGE